VRPLASPKPQPGVISEWLAAPVRCVLPGPLPRSQHLPDDRQHQEALRKRSCGQSFGIVFLETFFRGVRVGEDLDVLGITNLLAGVDVDKDGHWSLFSLRLP
jgi:hypothetical protein